MMMSTPATATALRNKIIFSDENDNNDDDDECCTLEIITGETITFQRGESYGTYLPNRCNQPDAFPCYCNPDLYNQLECPYCGFSITGDGTDDTLLCARHQETVSFFVPDNKMGDVETCSCYIPTDLTANPIKYCAVTTNSLLLDDNNTNNNNDKNISPPSDDDVGGGGGSSGGGSSECVVTDTKTGHIIIVPDGESFEEYDVIIEGGGLVCGNSNEWPTYCNAVDLDADADSNAEADSVSLYAQVVDTTTPSTTSSTVVAVAVPDNSSSSSSSSSNQQQQRLQRPRQQQQPQPQREEQREQNSSDGSTSSTSIVMNNNNSNNNSNNNIEYPYCIYTDTFSGTPTCAKSNRYVVYRNEDGQHIQCSCLYLSEELGGPQSTCSPYFELESSSGGGDSGTGEIEEEKDNDDDNNDNDNDTDPNLNTPSQQQQQQQQPSSPSVTPAQRPSNPPIVVTMPSNPSTRPPTLPTAAAESGTTRNYAVFSMIISTTIVSIVAGQYILL
jgi:FtsZ-interacting cell division protein YlmF